MSIRGERARNGRVHAIWPLLATLASFGCAEPGDDAPGGAGAAGTGSGSGASGAGGSSSGAGGASAGRGGTAGTDAQGGGPGAAALAACRAFCAAEDACDPGTTLAECESTTCVNPLNPAQSVADSPVDCQQALTGYWTCLATGSDPCNRDGCPGDSDSVVSACF